MPKLNIEISKEAKSKFSILLACQMGVYKKASSFSTYLMEKVINEQFKKLKKKGL